MYTKTERNFIRDYYKYNYDYNMCPYFIEWKFTHIEKNVWQDIRSNGIKLKPEFPVLNYFIDFADPILGIGIEVDGQEYHKDKEKDIKRQKEIENLGWKIYRFDGKDTFFNEFDYEEEKYYDRPYNECFQEWYNDLSKGQKDYYNLMQYLKEIRYNISVKKNISFEEFYNNFTKQKLQKYDRFKNIK